MGSERVLVGQSDAVAADASGVRIDAGLVPLVLGGLGMIGFSLTLPASRAAVPMLGGVFVGLGRAVVAAGIAAAYLAVSRAPMPARRDLGSLALVAVGVVFGFPLLSALAMRTLPASHGAVVTGLIPAATALIGTWRARERPPVAFWIACAAGVASVLVFAAVEGAGRPHAGDALLLGAVVAAGLGYTEGARLARAWGRGSGTRVISWALVLAAPLALTVVLTVLAVDGRPHFAAVGAGAWVGFGYVSVVSAYVAMFPWYAGLARGGIARVGQVQLLQPVITVGWASLLLGEPMHVRTVLAAFLVMASAGAAVLIRNRPGHATLMTARR